MFSFTVEQWRIITKFMETKVTLKLFQKRSVLFQSFQKFTTISNNNRPLELAILWLEF